MDTAHNRDLGEKHKRTARLFRNGRNQAVRLPRDYEIQAEEVYIERAGETLILTPKPQNWDAYFTRARRLSDDVPERVDDLSPGEREAL
ncbi:MAG: antitoxin [Gammaproteobacteria bacterium]